MKASELMIGDIVNLGYRDLALKVLGTDGKKGVVFVEVQDNFKLQISYDEEEVKPFPLTEEILKANGFEQNGIDGRLCLSNDDDEFLFTIVLQNGENFWIPVSWYGKGLTLKYVHELQHALRLCGLNDLADNFKVTNSNSADLGEEEIKEE